MAPCGVSKGTARRFKVNYPVNKFQPVVNPDTSIVFFGELFDVGVRVVKWYERRGYDGYSKKRHVTTYDDRKTGKKKTKIVKGKRYGGRWPNPGRKLTAITQFMVHHTGGFLPGVCFGTLHNERRLSVHFILDDKGVIYQTLDCKEIAWHGGKQNRRSIGVECCLYPKAWSNPGAYSEKRCERLGLAEHDVGQSYIQGKDRMVFLMPDEQAENLAFLIAGTWFARDCLAGRVDTAPVFPSFAAGNPDMDYKPEHKEHVGLVMHSNVSTKKWDAAGVDSANLQKNVATIYEMLKEGVENA